MIKNKAYSDWGHILPGFLKKNTFDIFSSISISLKEKQVLTQFLMIFEFNIIGNFKIISVSYHL